MKRVNPLTMIQSRPLASSLCVSIYADDARSLIEGIESAREIAQRDHPLGLVDKAFASVDEWARSSNVEKLRYPVAVFAAPGFSGLTYLPSIAKNLSVVSTSFHVKPLLKWLQREKSFVVIRLESKGTQFYQGSVTAMRAVDRLDRRRDEEEEEFYARTRRFARELFGGFSTPTLLAGPRSMTDAYFSVAGDKTLVPTAITSPWDLDTTMAMHEAAIRLLEPHMRKIEDNLVRSYWKAQIGGATSSSLHELVPLGLQGRIKHLFVSEKMNLWGQIDYRTGRFSLTREQYDAFDDCILDDLSEIVLFHGGQVTVLPSERMPNNHAACGILKSGLQRSVVDRDERKVV